MKLTPDQVVAALVQRGVPAHVAQGVAMNFQDESGLDTGIEERRANVHGTKGFGIAQWTGIRRIALEEYARSQGKPANDPDMQFDFFMQENAGPESGAWKVVMNSPNAQEAAANFVSKWERPAKKHELARIAKYRGDSPSEGGAKFGGSGLGDPANPVPITTPVAPDYAANAPLAPAAPKKPTLGETLKAGAGDLLNNLGSIAGGGAPAALPRSTAPQAGVPLQLMPLEAMAVGNTSAQDALRNQLAQRMALLNSGKLWG